MGRIGHHNWRKRAPQRPKWSVLTRASQGPMRAIPGRTPADLRQASKLAAVWYRGAPSAAGFCQCCIEVLCSEPTAPIPRSTARQDSQAVLHHCWQSCWATDRAWGGCFKLGKIAPSFESVHAQSRCGLCKCSSKWGPCSGARPAAVASAALAAELCHRSCCDSCWYCCFFAAAVAAAALFCRFCHFCCALLALTATTAAVASAPAAADTGAYSPPLMAADHSPAPLPPRPTN